MRDLAYHRFKGRRGSERVREMTGKWIERARQSKLHPFNVVDGRRITPSGDRSIRKRGPRDGALLYEFNISSTYDVNTSLEKAQAAYLDGRWSSLSLGRRKTVLLEW